MAKKLSFALLLLLIIGGSAFAFAWWDNLEQDLEDQEFELGYGVRLVVDSVNKDSRTLVPTGSFYAAYEADFTTEFVFTYTLKLEEPLKDGMTAKLDIDIDEFTQYIVDTEAYTFNDDGVINVSVDGATFDAGVWTTDSDVFDDETNSVTITVRISLEEHPNSSFEDFYEAVKGLEIDFKIGFKVVNTGSSSE